MLEDDKINLANRLEEKSTELSKISNMQLDTLSQLMNIHHELNMKDIEISTLKLQNEQLQNELKREKEIAENLNKSSEAIKYFEQLMQSPRTNNDTSGLGFTSTEVGETSKGVEKKVTKVRILNTLVISVIKRGILLTFAGVEGSINITYLRVKGIVTSATCMVT